MSARTMNREIRNCNCRPNIKILLLFVVVLLCFLRPKLDWNSDGLKPAFVQSKGRCGVTMVVGIPSTKRLVKNYLMTTLRSLVDSMNSMEKDNTLIIIFIAETDLEYVSSTVKEINVEFPMESEAGLIEVISPLPSYYPDFSTIQDTLGDTHERVVWRSKENLDFAFLMDYARIRGTFYVQLEDDVVTKKNVITTMENFALDKIRKNVNWFIIQFYQLGPIGTLTRSKDLPSIIEYLQKYYDVKPVDWLYLDFIKAKACKDDDSEENCKKAKDELWLHGPSLFQHVGIYLSLKGKIQDLKDDKFEISDLSNVDDKSNATVETSIKLTAENLGLYTAYRGKLFFRGFNLEPGHHVEFTFGKPMFIKTFWFRSGNADHPRAIFHDDTTIEVLTESLEISNSARSDVTKDGWVVVGKFDSLGIAQGTIGKLHGRVKILRMTVKSTTNEAIVSEMHIIEDDA